MAAEGALRSAQKKGPAFYANRKPGEIEQAKGVNQSR